MVELIKSSVTQFVDAGKIAHCVDSALWSGHKVGYRPWKHKKKITGVKLSGLLLMSKLRKYLRSTDRMAPVTKSSFPFKKLHPERTITWGSA